MKRREWFGIRVNAVKDSFGPDFTYFINLGSTVSQHLNRLFYLLTVPALQRSFDFWPLPALRNHFYSPEKQFTDGKQMVLTLHFPTRPWGLFLHECWIKG
jgi:hypothetical protein